jgi:hypothetical protein
VFRVPSSSVPSPSDGAIDLLARTLVKSGHRVSDVDRKNAEITTYWEDTGYRYRETDDLEDETSIFLRFHVKVADAGANHEVRVTLESERCVPYRAVVTATEVVSTCLDMPRILPSHQKVLNDLGRRLSEALASVPDAQCSPGDSCADIRRRHVGIAVYGAARDWAITI